MRYCRLNDCDNYRSIRPCCLYCGEKNECPEKCRRKDMEKCRLAERGEENGMEKLREVTRT